MHTTMLCNLGVFSSATMCSRGPPGLGHHAGAVARADFLLIGLDQEVERGRIDVTLLAQHGLQRAHAQLRFRELGMVVVAVVIVRHAAQV
jgi:hypothetical protein